MTKIVGIIGGMGPLASVDLQRKIIENTVADEDQDHLHVITDCNSQIPDRTAAILHGGKDPLPEMINSAKRLEQAGAQVLVMACNTAHFYLEQMRPAVSIPFLSMIEAAIEEAKRQDAKRVVIFSTTATQEKGLYELRCQKEGMEVLALSEEEKELMMRIIYAMKAGVMDHGIEEAKALLERKRQEGADVFFTACTELAIYFQEDDFVGPFVDPTEALARKVVRYAGGKLKPLTP
ncbi:MAG TPA: amino acid racemase [Tissierellia bacterium]|nr:amino acid racemase [Tissierellia bacterium]